MDKMFEVAAGIDVHRDTVVVSVRRRRGGAKEAVQTQTFETFHDTLVCMAQWLEGQGVEVVGLESTGVYWRPVVQVLQRQVPKALVWLVNPAEVKKVPGRKTDVKDSEWLSKLVMYGLVAPSLLPTESMQELRTLSRHRTKLMSHLAAYKNRITKEMEAAGIKLPTVCSDPLGKSARAMLAALLAGQKTPTEIADLAVGALRRRQPELVRAVAGSFCPASQFVLKQLMQRLSDVERDIASVDEQLHLLLQPDARELELLCTVPGIDTVVAAAILAEIGADMSRFGSADQLAAWSGLSPGSNQSAGKNKAAPTRKGNKYLRTMLVQASHGAVKKRDCFFRQKYGQLVVRLGPGKAHVAIARKMLVAIYYILRDHVPYQPPALPPPSPRRAKHLVSLYTERLSALGFQVHLTPILPEPLHSTPATQQEFS